MSSFNPSADLEDTAERGAVQTEKALTYDQVRHIIGLDPATLDLRTHRTHMEERDQAAWLEQALSRTVGR